MNNEHNILVDWFSANEIEVLNERRLYFRFTRQKTERKNLITIIIKATHHLGEVVEHSYCF